MLEVYLELAFRLALSIATIFIAVYVIFSLIGERANKSGNKIPLRYIEYEDKITLYRRFDGLIYQRIGQGVQVQAVCLRNGEIHKLGKPISISPNELVEIMEIRHV